MEDSITIRHELSSFSVTEEPRLVTTRTGKEIYVTRGKSTVPGPRRCTKCGNVMYRYGRKTRRLRDIDLLGHLSIIEVSYDRYCCASHCCGHTEMQGIAFKEPGRYMTERLARRIRIRLNCGEGISEPQSILNHSQYSRQEKERISSFS